jgi:hypothetical protein
MVAKCSSVNTFLSKVRIYGSMREHVHPATRTGNFAYKLDKGISDYTGHHPFIATFPGTVRMIAGAAWSGNTEYLMNVTLNHDLSRAGVIFNIQATLLVHPVSRGGNPDFSADKEAQVCPAITFNFPIGKKKTPEDYYHKMSPEKIFDVLAIKNKAFREMIKRFNACVRKA